MTVTIYHNPRCSKSRQTLALLQQQGLIPEVIEYLKTPPDTGTLTALMDCLGLTDPRAAMRKKEAAYKEQNLDDPARSRNDLIKAIAEHPVLLERPIVVTAKGARICRPPELVQEILPENP